MGAPKERYKDTKIHLASSLIVDAETGEMHNIGNASLMKRESTGEITYNSKEYVIMDTEKLKILLAKGMKQVDLALLITLSSNILFKHNICMFSEDIAHKTSTIAKLTGNSEQAVKLKLNRLIDLGLLYYGEIKEKKRFGKVYVMNPHFIRKGIKFSSYLGALFDDIKFKNSN